MQSSLSTYVSPFEELGQHSLAFQDTLEQILNDLEKATECVDNEPKDRTTLALYPPRLIRACMDHKIEHPTQESEELLKDATEIALEIYRRPYGQRETIQELRERIQKVDRSLLEKRITQPDDRTTAHATRHERSTETAVRLKETIDSSVIEDTTDVLFIAIGHGGIAAGMDVYLQYCELTESQNSKFYPVRFSVHKKEDDSPQVTESEIRQLRQLARGRRVVLFDEDKATGVTLRIAYNFFKSIGLPCEEELVITNYDLSQSDKLYINGLELLNKPSFSNQNIADETSLSSLGMPTKNNIIKEHKKIKDCTLNKLGQINPYTIVNPKNELHFIVPKYKMPNMSHIILINLGTEEQTENPNLIASPLDFYSSTNVEPYIYKQP